MPGGSCKKDGYVGYVDTSAISDHIAAPSHKIARRLTHIYDRPNLKFPPVDFITLDAGISVEAEDGNFVCIGKDRFITESHIVPLLQYGSDFVALAASFEGTPYLWGGKSALGIDCSGLVQLCLAFCGIDAPRDSDMQQQQLGTPVSPNGPYQRGDLVFFRGHVGIMFDSENLLHANAFHMAATIDPLQLVIDRTGKASGEAITAVKRL